MKKKISIISIITVFVLMVCTFVGCSSSKLISAEYDKDTNISSVTIQYVNKFDVYESSIENNDYYRVGGVYDSDALMRPVIRYKISGKTKNGKDTEDPGNKGDTVNIIITFHGDYKGCVLRIWCMDEKNARLFSDPNRTEDSVDFIKKHATILEWKL